MYNLIIDNNTKMLYNEKVSIEKKLELITNFSAHGNKTRACRETGFNYVTFLYHFEHDDEFRSRLRSAKEALIDMVEEEQLKNATTAKGFKDRKMFLEAHRPDKYSTKVKHQIETKDDRLLGLLSKAKDADKIIKAIPLQTDTLVNNNSLIKNDENNEISS